MVLLYTDPLFLEHRTGRHPECGERLVATLQYLQWIGTDARCRRPSWESLTLERLACVHSLEYAEELETFAKSGGGWIESDTFVSPRSYEVALHGAGAAWDAVQQIVAGEDRRAFCLTRPPGHHALANRPMGFCLFNNVAIGARLAISELQLDRVLIVDWDVHHGNGTQEIFWEDGQVGFFSIHRWPFYPGTGSADETGSGAGLGMTRNLPIEFGTPRAEYLSQFASELEDFASRVRPQLVFISAGFDSHREDPVGSLGLETEDFAELTRKVLGIADQYAGGRVVSILEGGYDLDALSHSIDVHLHAMLSQA
ncbi:MAG: histone deacetylase [Planctomycetes bacterium]|nr:histone deacetylase [Planctomycetota bacterium]